MKAIGVHKTVAAIEGTLERGIVFAYTRFGDGDLIIVDKPDSFNGNLIGNHYTRITPELKTELKEAMAIPDPEYFKALSVMYDLEPGMVEVDLAPDPNSLMLSGIAEKYIKINGPIYNPIAFHYLAAKDPDKLFAFLDKNIKPLKKMFIGGCSQAVAEKLFGKIDVFIKTDFQDSYSKIEDIWRQVEPALAEVDLVLPATGFASRVISKRIWLSSNRKTTIDFGSIVDFFDGADTREWIRMAK